MSMDKCLTGLNMLCKTPVNVRIVNEYRVFPLEDNFFVGLDSCYIPIISRRNNFFYGGSSCSFNRHVFNKMGHDTCKRLNGNESLSVNVMNDGYCRQMYNCGPNNGISKCFFILLHAFEQTPVY